MVKEKKYLFTASIGIVLAILMVLFMSSCKKDILNTVREKEEIAQVSVASIKYDGETLTWNSVLHADSYEIKVNNDLKTSSEASLAIVVEENVKFEIRGLVDESNERFKSCTTFSEKNFEYKGKIEVKVEGRTLTWEAIPDADGYRIMENDSLYQGYQTETSYNLVAVQNEDGTYTSKFKAKAEFKEEKYFSVWSDEKVYQILATPTNVKYDGKVITWDPVIGAETYDITIKGNNGLGVETTFKKEQLTEPKYVFTANGDDDGSGDKEAIQFGTFSFEIVAKAPNKDNVLDSDEKNFSLSYVEPIQNIYMVDGVVTWDAVPNAEYYILKINGVEQEDLKVYTNRYEGIKNSCTISVMPQREDGTLYSNWSANATMTYVETPNLTWEYDDDNTAYYLDWQKKENGEAYPVNGKTFSVIVYEVYGDSLDSLEFYSSENNREITQNATMSYSNLFDFANFTKGKKYAVRVIATSGDQEITTASSQLSNPVFFYFIPDPSAYTQTSTDIYDDKISTTVLFNDVQIPEAFKGFDLSILYKCSIKDSNNYTVEGGEIATTSTRKITINDADDNLEHKYTLAIQTTSADDKKMLTDSQGNRIVFMFSDDPTMTNEKTYELTRLTAPNVTLTGSTLTWDSISKASGYMVKIVKEGTEEAQVIPTSSRAYSLSELEAGKYDVYVAAKGNGNIVLSSKYSNVYHIEKLPTPTNIRVEKISDEDRIITWDAVEGCTSYQYTLGTSTQTVLTNQSRIISKDLLSIAGVNFSVIAIGNDSEHLISSNSSTSLMLYKLATPKNVILKDDIVRWDEINAIGGSAIGYNIYNGLGNLMNDEPLTVAMFDIYDYIDVKENYGIYDLNVYVEAVSLDEAKNNYWPSDNSTSYTVQRLASPTNINMNQYTGEITWDQYSGENPDYVAGYSIKIVYANHPNATESYYVTTNSFTPDFKYFENETVEITVRAVGNMVNTISSNPFNVTTEGEENKIGCVAKLEKLATLDNLNFVTFDVDDENHIKICIDANMTQIKGNGYGISIGGVNNVIRTYNASEDVYHLLADTIYEYTLANGSKAQYDLATNKYTYISRYSSAGTYEIKVRVEGGNYSQDPNTVSKETVCYVTSDYTAQSKKVIILGQLSQNDLKLSSDKKMITFNDLTSAVSYEYTIQYTRAGGIPVGEAISGTVNATGASSTIAIDIPEGANSIVISIRAIGDGVTVFSSIRTTTTEIIISNTK